MTDTGPPVPPAPPVLSVPPGRRPGRGLRIALAVSVALNLGVAGLVIGMAVSGGPGGPRQTAVRDLSFGLYTDALSREDRVALRRAFMGQGPDFRELRQVLRADLTETLSALREVPFAPGEMRAVMLRQSHRTAERLDLGQDLLLDRISEMTSAERAAFADRLEARLTRDGRDRDGAQRRP